MVKDFILDIIHLHNDYTSTGMYMALYFMSLLYIGVYKGKEGSVLQKDRRDMILFPSLIILTMIYFLFPFVKVFLKSRATDDIRSRSFWMLMISAVVAVGLSCFVSELEDEKKKFIAILSGCLILALSGEFKINDHVFQKAENLYKLPQALLDIADTVLSDREKGDFNVSELEKNYYPDPGAGMNDPLLIVPYETAHVFRQYSTDINLLYGEDATFARGSQTIKLLRQLCARMATETPDLNLINDIAKDYGVDYIVFDCVYHRFGGESLNYKGYTEDPDFAGSRSPIDEDAGDFSDIKVLEKDGEPYWDLSEYDMEYVGTYGQYLLYRFRF